MSTRRMTVVIIVMVVVAFVACAEARGVEAVGKEQLGRAALSAPPKDHDFTKIPQGAAYKAGELLVHFMPKANGRQQSRAEKNAVLAAIGGGHIKHSFGLVPGLSHVLLPKGLTVEQALRRFNRRSEILYAEPNYEVHVVATPNDPRFSDLWAMHNTGQTAGTSDADIDAPEAWDKETDANEIVVAVIDTGVDYSHEDLAANMWTDANNSYGYDFVNDDNDPMDDAGHGTHCAGTIGAVGNNNTGVVGVCWDVQIMALKFLDSSGRGYTDDAIAAIGYAVDNGAHVLSNSWGGGPYSEGLKEAIEAADANGVLFVASAGNNNGSNNDIFLHYPSSYDCKNIIAVMSTDHDDDMSSFSNYGPTSVDLGAPGSDILSCKLGGGYTYMNGTSMATPHVAGACALVWSEHPSMSHLDVKGAVLWTVDELDDLDANCVTNGRLNLYWALENKMIKNLTQGKFYDAIQDAVDEANDLDVIQVREGIYYEAVDFNGVCCTLTSIDPNDPDVVAATIIDANGAGAALTFDGSEDANAVLAGFTITGGNRGIYCNGTSPTITKCVVSENGVVGDMLGHWKLDDNADNTTVADGSGNGNNGTGSKNTSLFHTDTCKAGTGAFEFDGDDYVDLGNDSSLKIQRPLTLAAWVKIGDDFTGSKGVICLGSWGSNYYGVHLAISSAEQVFIQYGNGIGGSGAHRRGKLGSTSLSQNTWYHIAGVVTSPTSMKVYINGVDDGGSYIGSHMGGIGYGSGSSVIGNRPSSGYFDGTIDDAMVFDRVVSADEMAVLHGTGRIGIGSKLAHWKMDDDASSTSVADSSGNGNNGTASKNTSLFHTDTSKVGTGAFEFDGRADYVDIGNNVKPSLPISVSMWIEPNSLGTNQWLLENDKYTGSNYYGIWAYIKTTNAISIAYGDGGSPGPASRRSKASSSTVSSSEWQHIAFVIRGAADMDIYIDGTNAGGTYSGSGGTLAYSGANGGIGSHGGSSYFFDGKIDEAMVFERALSEDDVEVLCNFGAGGICCANEASPTITRCTFNRNTAVYGAGMCNLNSSPTVTYCVFSGNVAGADGGAVYDHNSNPNFTNCIFTGSVAFSTGGGVANDAADPTVTSSTFSRNSAANYGGGLGNSAGSSPKLTNCILWDNQAGLSDGEVYNTTDADPNFRYCDVNGCGGSSGWDLNFGTDGGGNIDAEPNFVDPNDPDGQDDLWMTPDDGLVLDPHDTDPNSPCVDAGDNDAITLSTDIAGTLRKRDDPCTTDSGHGTAPIVDMGAYEYAANATIYVDVNATGGVYNGLSWSTAFKDFQAAVDYSINADKILVAEGTYVLTSTIHVAKEVEIYGGYDASTGQRDTKNNLTTVDGNDAVRCFCVTADCTVDGFTITDGNAWDPGSGTCGTSMEGDGGGMLNYRCDPNINDCNFYQNRAYDSGGGMKNYYSDTTITDCNFTGNVAGGSGGGVYNSLSSPTVTNCTFAGNSAQTRHGGGMRNLASNANVSDCIFSENDANNDGGGMANMYSDPNVIGCTFSNNTAYIDGAGMANYFSDLNVIECTFSSNAASNDGGGMHNEECTLTLDDCVFSQNTAGDNGGGMDTEDSLGMLTSCVFWDNNSVDDGGGIHNRDYCPNLINCTFVLNESLDGDGGGIYNRDVSDALVINCIVYYNYADGYGGEIYNHDSEPNLSFCDIDDCGGSGEDWDTDCGIDGGNNIEDSPIFGDRYDGDGSDGIWGTCDDGLNLDSSSPCKNEGDDNAAAEDYDGKDVKGSDRIIDGDVDMGAYEYDSGC